MLLKYAITFLAFGFGVAIAGDDVLKEKISLPDSVCKKRFEMFDREKVEELQKKSQAMIEKYRKMLEESKEIQERLKERLEKGELKIMPVPTFVEKGRFDDTGLIIGDRKYFIRIWKHPPKELFNMPTKPMK